MANSATDAIPAQIIPKSMTIDGMPTFTEQVKLHSKQRVKLEAKLAEAKVKDAPKKPGYVIGPAYLNAVGQALAVTMKSNKDVTNFLKVQQFYADLKEGIYKALATIHSYAAFKQFLSQDKFYSSVDSDPCADVRNFVSMCLGEMSRFENSSGYKDANATQKDSMKQNELSVLENYASALNNSSQEGTTFIKKVRNDQDGVVSSFAGIGDFLNNVCMGYANDM